MDRQADVWSPACGVRHHVVGPWLGGVLALALTSATACGGDDTGAGGEAQDTSLVRAEALATSLERSALLLHLEDLQGLADANAEQPGVRPREGTRAWARGRLEAAGWEVSEQDFTLLNSACGERCAGTNLVATWPSEPEGLAVLVTAHFDAVKGPGINDNGTGIAAVVELATQAASLGIADEVPIRIALFDREEGITTFGANAYLSGSSEVPFTPEPGPVVAELLGVVNIDMIGSLNGVPGRVVYADPDGSMVVADALQEWFGRSDETMVTWPIELLHEQKSGFDSDVFATMGVPVATVFAGGWANKSAEEAELYGGVAEQPYASCYHAACDGVQNVDPELMTELTRAAAWAVGRLAGGDGLAPSR